MKWEINLLCKWGIQNIYAGNELVEGLVAGNGRPWGSRSLVCNVSMFFTKHLFPGTNTMVAQRQPHLFKSFYICDK